MIRPSMGCGSYWLIWWVVGESVSRIQTRWCRRWLGRGDWSFLCDSSSSRQSCRTLNLLVMAVMGERTLGWTGVDCGTSDGGIEALDR